MWALPDSMAAVVGGDGLLVVVLHFGDDGAFGGEDGFGGLGGERVHWRFRFLMNGFGMRSAGCLAAIGRAINLCV